MEPVCLDASLVLYLVLPGPMADRVEALVGEWLAEGRKMVAPRLWVWELANVLWRWTKRAEKPLPVEAAREGLRRLLQLPVELWDVEEQALEAWDELLVGKGLASAYDACYITVARAAGGKVWTCDRRLAEMAEGTGLVEVVWE